ncbi:unnamed protein product, partial [Laminaria digitata]
AANSCSHDGCACTSAKDGKCVCGEDHPHLKYASVAANSCSHDGCACTSAEDGKCVCGEDHPHLKNASVAGELGANSCCHDGCACTSAEDGQCVCGEDHPHLKNASVAANSCSHDGCACTSAEDGKCVCGEDHPHLKNASVAGSERGSKKGRKDHARGGAGVRRKVTLGQLLRPRPASTLITPCSFFKCPNGCGRVDGVGDRWFFDVLSGGWRYVGPRCQPRGGHSAAEMVLCSDAEGKEEYGDKEMKAMPFVGSSRASQVVRKNQDDYVAWLKEEQTLLEKESRQQQYGTETESAADFNDAQTYYQEGSLWHDGAPGNHEFDLVELMALNNS